MVPGTASAHEVDLQWRYLVCPKHGPPILPWFQSVRAYDSHCCHKTGPLDTKRSAKRGAFTSGRRQRLPAFHFHLAPGTTLLASE